MRMRLLLTSHMFFNFGLNKQKRIWPIIQLCESLIF